MVARILAWDYSGSTANMPHYFNTGIKYIKKFRAKTGNVNVGAGDQETVNEQDPIYLIWDNSCQQISAGELDRICRVKEGRGGTCPSSIIEWIKKSISKDEEIELWLITDGEIDSSELARCSTLNTGMNYSKIKFIIINQREVNLSVGASFFRGSQIEIYSNEQIRKRINLAQPFDYDGITAANFESRWDDLSDFIQAKFMGSDLESLEEVDKLHSLRARVLKQISIQDKPGKAKPLLFSSKNKLDILNDLKSCKFYKTLTNAEVKDVRCKIDASISTLVNYIHQKNKSFTFDSLKIQFKQEKLLEFAAEEEPDVDAIDDIEDCKFYDVITLDMEEGVPVLLLNTTDLIEKYWLKGSYSKFRGILECPLGANIEKSIGHVYLLETFKALMEKEGSPSISNPMTNQPVFGGLVFSARADPWNDFVVSKSFFRGKKVKTPLSLWYYIIWKHAENVQWIEPSVKEQLKSYAFRRLQDAKVRLAFSSLPLDPEEIVPVAIACFYCTEGSSLLFAQHPTLFSQERLRMYGAVAHYMLDILNHFGYQDVDTEFVKKRAKLFQQMNVLKRIPQEIEKRYFLLQQIFESKDNFLLYKIKNPGALKHLNVLNYHHKNSIIPFDHDSSPVDIRKFVQVSYDYEKLGFVGLSLETFRPHFVVKEQETDAPVPYYTQLLPSLKLTTLTATGEIHQTLPVQKIEQKRLISPCKHYIDLTNILGKYPTFPEYSAYVAKAKRIYGDRIRLFPLNVLKDLQETFELYSSLTATANIPVQQFIKKTQSSISIEVRIEMEKTLRPKYDVKRFINEAKQLLTEPFIIKNK